MTTWLRKMRDTGRYNLVSLLPGRLARLGVDMGNYSYVTIGVVTALSTNQRLIALLGWPTMYSLFALFFGIKEYRRLRQGGM